MSRSGDWYIRTYGDEKGDDWSDDGYEDYLITLEENRYEAEIYLKHVFNSIKSWHALPHHSEEFRKAIWYASTVILPKLEVQVVIDGNNNCHISSGTAGYVDFKIDPVGMKLPIKCWIHTHPFGSAYFSGVDINTVSTWEPLMECAIVIGGNSHWGSWSNKEPRQLQIVKNNRFERTQVWGKINSTLSQFFWDGGEEE